MYVCAVWHRALAARPKPRPTCSRDCACVCVCLTGYLPCLQGCEGHNANTELSCVCCRKEHLLKILRCGTRTHTDTHTHCLSTHSLSLVPSLQKLLMLSMRTCTTHRKGTEQALRTESQVRELSCVVCVTIEQCFTTHLPCGLQVASEGCTAQTQH